VRFERGAGAGVEPVLASAPPRLHGPEHQGGSCGNGGGEGWAGAKQGDRIEAGDIRWGDI